MPNILMNMGKSNKQPVSKLFQISSVINNPTKHIINRTMLSRQTQPPPSPAPATQTKQVQNMSMRPSTRRAPGTVYSCAEIMATGKGKCGSCGKR